jgi:hypothetical protein
MVRRLPNISVSGDAYDRIRESIKNGKKVVVACINFKTCDFNIMLIL